MEYFDRSKASIIQKLEKEDKSRKGDVDVDAKPVILALNNSPHFYTTSSCSGRISLFREAKSKKKFDSGWLFVKHGEVTKHEIIDSLKSVPFDTVWFRQEAPIFHVACRDQDSALLLLELCRDLGFKHSGIIGLGRRVMVEIIFNEKIDCPISENKELLVCDDHLDLLISKANEKLRRNNFLLKKFSDELKKRF
jgi:tRNA wybutosine-synthesizing protein 3